MELQPVHTRITASMYSFMYVAIASADPPWKASMLCWYQELALITNHPSTITRSTQATHGPVLYHISKSFVTIRTDLHGATLRQ